MIPEIVLIYHECFMTSTFMSDVTAKSFIFDKTEGLKPQNDTFVLGMDRQDHTIEKH